MIEALWSVEFLSNVQDSGAGVAVFETGRILGGDGNYYYVGSYEIKNNTVNAEISVTHYSGAPNSVFGPAKQFDLKVSGQISNNSFTVNGHVVQNPNLVISIRLTRRAELP